MSKHIYAAPDPTQTVIYKQRRPRDGNRSHRGDTVDRGQLKLSSQEERGEHIYESLDDVRGCDTIAGPQETTAGGQPRGQRVVALCLGMMCLTLLAVFTGLTVHYKLAYEQLQINYNNLTLERNELQTRYENITLERDILTIERDNLTLERDKLTLERDKLTLKKKYLTLDIKELTMDIEDLTMGRDRLAHERENLTLKRNKILTKYKDMTLEINTLMTKYNNMTFETSNLLTKFNNMTQETKKLLTKYKDMTLETSNLLTKFNNMTLERNQLESWSGVCGVPAIKPKVSGCPSDGLGINKEEAVPHSWPWHVSLQTYQGVQWCGGSLINKDWVVTAANCDVSTLTRRHVILGQHNLKQAHNIQKIRIGKVFDHPEYNAETYDYDITLIKLQSSAQVNDHVSPVCVAETGDNLANGLECVATGWGRTSEHSPPSDKLQQLCVPLIGFRECNSNISSRITRQMFCAGAAGANTCSGDGGGPLVCKMLHGAWTLYGVTSWGKGCATNVPGVYSRITVLRDWMDQIMANN